MQFTKPGGTVTKSANSASTLIRGGQTTQHWWRMGAQVVKFSLVVAAFFYVGFFIFLVFSSYNPDEMRIAIYYELAERGVLDDNGFNRTYVFRNLQGLMVTMEAVDLYRDTMFRSVRDGFFDRIFSASRISVLPAIIAGILSLFVFLRTGNRIQDNEFIRGARLVTAGQLKSWSQARWRKYNKTFKGRKKAKPLTVSGIPFPPNTVEAQTCLYGTVGVGKTNAMSEMLATIRENHGRAVVYDRMGTFVSRFYDEERDIIINPFDNRSKSWNLFDDVLDAASFTQLSEVMIPEKAGAASDPFWSQSARIVFDYAAGELYKTGPKTVKALIDYVIRMEVSELSKLISSTPGAHFFNEDIAKTALSIRANLISELRFLEFLRDDAEAVSIRDWMASEEPSFLFLTGDAEHAAATRNIISVILEIAANALMSLGPASEPRCYFFIDELPSLNRLPFLVSSLAEIRQFGGAFVLGYQVYSQLEDNYGREAAQTIAGTTNNRIVFNTPDFRTAKLCSETLGNVDLWEANSNISVGAHEARDGVGFTQQRVERSIVSPAEIQNLPQFQAFVKFAYDSPTAVVTMKLAAVQETKPRFQPYMGDAFGDFGLGGSEPDGSGPGGGSTETSTVQTVVQEFHAWCRMMFDCTGLHFTELEDPHPHFKPYFDHFRSARANDVAPEEISAIVIVTEGLMKNSLSSTSRPSSPLRSGLTKLPPNPRASDRQTPQPAPRGPVDVLEPKLIVLPKQQNFPALEQQAFAFPDNWSPDRGFDT